MEIVADESVDYGIIRELVKIGFSVYSISDSKSGIDDREVLNIAFESDKLLITEDKDFGELVYRLKLEHRGILLIRLSNLPRGERISSSVGTIQKYFDKLIGNFSVLTDKGLRIKKI